MTATLTEAYYRRLYAFQDPSPVIPLEEFFNPNHDPADGKFTTGPRNKKIGTGPKGGKIWTGVSADPDNRVKPKSKVHFPLEPDDYESPAEARVRFATQVFDADLGNGYQARVAGVREIHNGIAVTIKIRKGHEEAGIATRELTIDGAGRLVAHHETFYIEPKHQGKGIADRLNAHAVAEYQRLGVDRIELHAGAEVGGYAWARQGFRIFEGDRKKFLNVQLNRMETQLLKPVLRPHAKRLKADTDALRNAIYAGEDVQPIHIASLGEKYARYTGRDNHGNEYPTWPGKSLLMGTTWLGQYYFDANRAVTAAATNLEHARLRSEDFYNHDLSAVRTEEFRFDPRQARDKDGKWTVSAQHVANRENAEAILRGGFSTNTPAWDRSFGDGVYLSEAGDAKSAKFYARQGGRDWRSSQVIESTVSLSNPLHIEAREHSNFRAEVVKALGGTEAVREIAQARYDHTVAATKRIVAEEVGADHGIPLDRPEKVNWYHVEGAENHPDTIFVSKHVEAASERILQRIEEETGDSPQGNASWHWLAKNIEKIAKPGQNTSSDNETHYSRLLGNLARDAGHDGIVINTNRWGGVGGQQIVVFDPSTIKVTGSHPYARTASAELAEALACHDAACAPPPAGTGGSSPTGALQARRGVVPGYGQQARRDIHLAGVRVTYKPDYPDDHPDPGEVVWAKVRYQEDVNQSKDRPVLIIGRINGTDKLAAVQLTSNDRPGKDRYPIGTGSWDRLGRSASVKLDQIIVVDPKDYRREGSTFGREKFDDVIGRLAAFHRTPVQIAAGATWVELYNQNHSPSDGRFTSGGGFRVITKAQARGDSRPVSDEEFQRLAETGRTQLEGYARNAKKINLTDEQWSQVKSGAYAEVRKPWGGATIDLHTGQELPQGVNAWAITVKSTKGKRTQSSISVHENATEEEFNAAMDQARKKFGYTLARESHYLGVFHDDANHRIDIDPVLVVRRHADVETIGAATFAIGGAYNFRDGLGYWPPHVDTSRAATNKRDDYVRTYD